MAKKTIKDLRPRDKVWYLDGKVYEVEIQMISTTGIRGENDFFVAKINNDDLTAWQFEAEKKYSSYKTIFYLNKIDALKARHGLLEKNLEDTYSEQQKYFESITIQNKLIYESNKEIINELKNI